MFDERPIGDLIANQVGGGTPSRQIPSFWNGSIPWASVKDFVDGGCVISSTQESITAKGLSASASNLIPAGTPMICTRMAVGRSAFASVDVAINQDVKALQPLDGTSRDYLLRLLQFIRPRAEAAAVGSTVKGIRIQDFLSILAPIAPAVEQSCIAEILNALDKTIRQTDLIIEKLKLVRKGLLHDLLTRGIDANGELRPPQSQAPHLYKDSPLGPLPKEWGVKFGREVCNSIGVGIVVKPTQYYRESGIPVLRSANVREHGLTMQSLVFMSARDHQSQSKSAVRPGDVLTVRTGYPGTSCVVDDQVAEANCVDIIISRPNFEITADFWCMWINSSFGKEQVLRVQGGLAQQHFNVGELAAMVAAIPSIDEQLAIVSRVAAIDARLRSEQSSVAVLNKLKAGLMDDLLTGRVRVTSLLDSEVA